MIWIPKSHNSYASVEYAIKISDPELHGMSVKYCRPLLPEIIGLLFKKRPENEFWVIDLREGADWIQILFGWLLHKLHDKDPFINIVIDYRINFDWNKYGIGVFAFPV